MYNRNLMKKFIILTILFISTVSVTFAQSNNDLNIDLDDETKAFVNLVNTKENKQLIYSLLRNTKRSVTSSKGLNPKIKKDTISGINKTEKAIRQGLTKGNVDKLTNSSLDDLGVNTDDPISVQFRKSK